MTKKDPAKMVFEMLGFQYKPLEAKMLASEAISQDFQNWYRNLSYIKKIRVLDKYAQALGL